MRCTGIEKPKRVVYVVDERHEEDCAHEGNVGFLPKSSTHLTRILSCLSGEHQRHRKWRHEPSELTSK